MSKIIVNTEVMGPDFSELVLHELNYEWSREVVTLAASEADLPFGMVLMREAGEYKPLTESTVESAQKLGGAPVAVLIGAVKASESAQPGIVIRRGAILNRPRPSCPCPISASSSRSNPCPYRTIPRCSTAPK